jgi:hypothetical protein
MNDQQEYDIMSNQENIPPPAMSDDTYVEDIYVYEDEDIHSRTVREPEEQDAPPPSNTFVDLIQNIQGTDLPGILWPFASQFEELLKDTIYTLQPSLFGHGPYDEVARQAIQNSGRENLYLYTECIGDQNIEHEVEMLLKWSHVLNTVLKSMACFYGRQGGVTEPYQLRAMLLLLNVLVPYLTEFFTKLGLETFDLRFEAPP